MGVFGDVRSIVQDLVTPRLKEISTKLEALARGQGAMKTELLRALVQAEEKLNLTLKLALLSQQNEQLQKQVNDLQKTAH